jgi:hypothetical protein
MKETTCEIRNGFVCLNMWSGGKALWTWQWVLQFQTNCEFLHLLSNCQLLSTSVKALLQEVSWHVNYACILFEVPNCGRILSLTDSSLQNTWQIIFGGGGDSRMREWEYWALPATWPEIVTSRSHPLITSTEINLSAHSISSPRWLRPTILYAFFFTFSRYMSGPSLMYSP